MRMSMYLSGDERIDALFEEFRSAVFHLEMQKHELEADPIHSSQNERLVSYYEGLVTGLGSALLHLGMPPEQVEFIQSEAEEEARYQIEESKRGAGCKPAPQEVRS